MFKLKDIMEMLNIPERTIRRHIKLGILKGEKAGGTWRFSENDLHAYFSSKTILQANKHVKTNEVFDFINGISKEGEEIMIIKQVSKLSISNNKYLSAVVSTFDSPFYFNLDTKMNKTIITFKGNEKDALKLIEEINILDRANKEQV
jgi:excisionase family DNA binding protein